MQFNTYFNKGIYELPMAARLLRMPTQTVRSWVSATAKSPLSSGDLPVIDGKEAISFAALIELLVARRLRDRGVSLQHLRQVLERLREHFDEPHPFALNLTLYTDARRRVFLETIKEAGDKKLLNIAEDQFEMKEIIRRTLSKGIKFEDDFGPAVCWQPDAELSEKIEVRPDVAFGTPIVSGTGIKAHVLFDAFQAERNAGKDEEDAFETVAEWYEIDPSAVKDAVLFERVYVA